MATGRVIVVGSVNQDYFGYVRDFPGPGETVLALEGAVGLGGKGANQAVAAALAGAPTAFIGSVGDDPAGTAVLRALTVEGVDVTEVVTSPGRTGAAYITVTTSGENTIVVDPGANARLEVAAIAERTDAAVSSTDSAVLLLQGELQSGVATAAIRAGRERSATLVLNLAPAIALADDILQLVDVLVLNEGEAAQVAGAPADAGDLARTLRERFGVAVVITLGADGAVLADADGLHWQPTPAPASVVDTTGAGDAFVGTLAAALAGGLPLRTAIAAGVAAGSIAVESPGTVTSYSRGRTASQLASLAPAVVVR